MKKDTILLFIIPIFLFSCNKENNVETKEIATDNIKQIDTEKSIKENKNDIENEVKFNQDNFDKDLENLFSKIFE